ILLMVSDGITESGTKWIPSQLQSLGSLSPQKICEGIIETAKIRNLTDRNDDMTVVAVKIEKADK
ncbi:MAG: SpoIIE family protein phosphatase, partial [Oscillospiraceae bacterium]